MLVIEYLGMSLFPPPPGFSLDSEEDLARLVASATTGKKLWVVTGWALAAVTGGHVAARVALRHRTGIALCVGGMVVAGVIFNSATLPHPIWMTTAGVLLPLPAAWLAARLVDRRNDRVPPA
jgi:hypothetical protein